MQHRAMKGGERRNREAAPKIFQDSYSTLSVERDIIMARRNGISLSYLVVVRHMFLLVRDVLQTKGRDKKSMSFRAAIGIVVSLCTVGGGLTLAVSPALAVSLPDGRAYELVSPAPVGQEANIDVPEWAVVELSGFYEHGVPSEFPFEVAPDGEKVVYPGDPPLTGGNNRDGFFGGGNQFMATRSSAGGWNQMDLDPTSNNDASYDGFTNDLSLGFLTTNEPLAAGVPQGRIPYSHATIAGAEGEYDPLFAAAGSGVPSGFGTVYVGANSGTSTVPAFSHILFEGNGALPVSGQVQPEAPEAEQNLYDSVGGELYLVNVLPNGKTEPGASFGGAPLENHGADVDHAISPDGSRIFWTGDASGNLYVRENDDRSESPLNAQGECTVAADACTVLIAEGGVFSSASADGSRVVFTKDGHLYRYELMPGELTRGTTADLTPGGEILGVAGTSEGEEYIYYVDSSYHLYLWHEGVSAFIATLSSADDHNILPFGGQGVGDWQEELGRRSAEVTPDGHSLIFVSRNSLTGYDNDEGGEVEDEVFLYEAPSSKLTCVSCNPTGAPPVPTEFNTYVKTEHALGAFLPVSLLSSYQPQLISDDGSRVVFQSGEPLVPQDTNGWLDVYEWERDGSGSCRESQGCVYLLSGGTDPENSYLIAASETGNDVFFVSRADLVAQDRGDDDMVYDARVGGVQPPAESECAGTGCQGVPPAPPVFATPSSVTFNGVGNFPATATTPVTPKAKPLTEAQKLAKALKVCRRVHSARKRSACEVRARKQYKPKSKAKKSDRRGK